MADEPSSGLDVHETAELANVLRTLQHERGMAVLLVEHDLGMVGEVVDRAIVMDLGRIIAEGTFDEVMADPGSARPIWGNRMRPGPRPGRHTGGGAAAWAPALEVDHVDAAYGPYRALFDVSFSVPDGGVVALLGSNGAGKSTVARVVSGLLPATGGRSGSTVPTSPAGRLPGGPGRGGPRARGPGGLRQPDGGGEPDAGVPPAGRPPGASPESLARAYEAFPVLGERRRQRGGTLSGGQQRLLSLAKVLVVPPKLLIADELSLGLAPVVVDAVYEGLRLINQAGTALLVVEQQVDRVLVLATSAVVLEHGTVAYDGPSDGATAAVEAVLAARGDRLALADPPPGGGDFAPSRPAPRPPAGAALVPPGYCGPGKRGTMSSIASRSIVDVLRTTLGKRGGALQLAPGRPAGLRPRPAGGADRGGPVPGSTT